MNTWEDILNAYLEGAVLRADAEALRWKIRLPDEARQQIDRDLRLADALESLGQSIAAPATGFSKLAKALHGEPAASAPENWRWTPSGPRGTVGAVSTGADDDDGGEDDDGLSAITGGLMQLGRLIAPPPGAVERLITRLHQESSVSAHDNTESPDETDRPIVLFPSGLSLAPDALAASKPDDPLTPPEGADRSKKPDAAEGVNERDGADDK